MNEISDLSRRRFLKHTAVGLAAASTLGLGASTGQANEISAGASSTIPELAPQWKKLDLAEILSRPAAFVSISQNKSLYETWGAQGAEKHRERTSLPATVKVVNAARSVTYRSRDAPSYRQSGSLTWCTRTTIKSPKDSGSQKQSNFDLPLSEPGWAWLEELTREAIFVS